MKIVKQLNNADIVKINGQYSFVDFDGTCKNIYKTITEATTAYYIKTAYDYLGSGIRDNSIKDKRYFGKQLDEGYYH